MHGHSNTSAIGANMNDSTRINDATRPSGNDDDPAAAKRLLDNIRERLDNLGFDLARLGRAIDGPPGAVSALAVELLDEDQDPLADLGPAPTGSSS
jgi:hypothetical protein